MTYQNLKDRLALASTKELQQNVTIFIRGPDEFYPAIKTAITPETDILDKGHLFLVV